MYSLNDFTLSIKEGQIFGLLGPNGAGKTTLISMLCGLVKPTSGSFSIDDLTYAKNANEIKKIIGVVPQEYALYPTLTARENLMYFGSMYGFRCLSTKVCNAVVIDKFIRHDVTVLMPRGALLVEVADTRSSRELGLSGRTSMRDTEGLLFVFDTPGRYGFWMKDMKFPLDIIWINQNGVVVEIERELDASSYPKVFTNRSEASYVLEINGGRAEHFGLYLGSKVKIVD